MHKTNVYQAFIQKSISRKYPMQPSINARNFKYIQYTYYKSSPAGLVLEFEIWRLKVITDLIYW